MLAHILSVLVLAHPTGPDLLTKLAGAAFGGVGDNHGT